MQPLDVAFFNPLQTFFNQGIQNWLKAHPGRPITIYNIAKLFKPAYERAASVSTACNGFRKTGLYSFNRNVFCESDFAAVEVTDVPITEIKVGVSDDPFIGTPVSSNNLPQNVEITKRNSSSCSSDIALVSAADISPFPKSLHRAAVRKRKLQCIY